MSDLTDKIRKLIAKAQSTTNPAEAAAFMNKATELMAANNLTMEAVDLGAIKEAKVKSQFSVSKPKDYELTLMSSIAESFGCLLMWQANSSWRRQLGQDNYAEVIFVGPADRLQLATYAAEVLGRQLAKARQKFSNDRSRYYWGAAAEAAEMSIPACKDDDRDSGDNQLRRMIGPRVTKESNSFAIGWVMEIRKKVTRFALNDREQVLLETYVNSKADPDAKVDTKKTELSTAAMLAGQAAAKDAQLHRPVGTNGEAAPLIGHTLALGHG